MIKVISIAVSTLLLGNIAFADTTNTDNNLLQSIQQKIDTKKSNLGSNVQVNSGLTGINKTPAKDTSKDTANTVKNGVVDQVSPSKVDKVEVVNTGISSTDTKVQVKPVPVEVKELIKPVETLSKKEEICEPVKPVVKKVFKKKIFKKAIVKASTAPIKNDFELVKTKNYTPIDFSPKQKWILNSQVKLSIQDKGNNFEVSISDTNGQVIPPEQFTKSFVRVVQISQNFDTIVHQEDEMNFTGNPYSFNKEVKNCAAVFVQYHLNSSAVATNLVQYVDKNGSLSDHIDSSCKQENPEDLPTNLNYSSINNISGLFFKNDKLLSTRPINFNIIFTKNGSTKTPNELFVYSVKPDFSDLRVIEPKTYGNASSGVIFETNLEKGSYILGYTFKEGKVENYFKNIHVD